MWHRKSWNLKIWVPDLESAGFLDIRNYKFNLHLYFQLSAYCNSFVGLPPKCRVSVCITISLMSIHTVVLLSSKFDTGKSWNLRCQNVYELWNARFLGLSLSDWISNFSTHHVWSSIAHHLSIVQCWHFTVWKHGAPAWSSWYHIGPQITTTWVWISTWAYLKGVSSLTLLHYLWRSLDPFSLPCAQKWPRIIIIINHCIKTYSETLKTIWGWETHS